MREKIYKILLAFFWGIGGYSIAYIILESLFYSGSKFIELIIRRDLQLQILILLSFGHILAYLGNSSVEEGIRFLVIKKLQIVNPYGFILGLSWELTENLYRHPEDMWNIPILHIVNAGIISYFIQKNKPILGLLIAFILHTGWNLLNLFI